MSYFKYEEQQTKEGLTGKIKLETKAQSFKGI